ncbi:predicted protein [Candida tropicalis MYA-3404]|uniref:Uncharacterized protein n=1 Tax=Candida tropicalis (strain ATCC MYA-3404 / T1) TaxID=294747 RepID=C5MIW3_CANTT|nr:predicted protein [Candida tropicalis MYA-3404]EER30222.1 predicted protein [Candida tropicalis MYA-3404]KAG4404172.1 hypothetical protein JTP64_001139 [Candida tropicalis]
MHPTLDFNMILIIFQNQTTVLLIRSIPVLQQQVIPTHIVTAATLMIIDFLNLTIILNTITCQINMNLIVMNLLGINPWKLHLLLIEYQMFTGIKEWYIKINMHLKKEYLKKYLDMSILVICMKFL